MDKTIKQEIESWLTTIDLHLSAAEDGIQANNSVLAEAEIDAARNKVRHAKAAAAKISD